MVSLSDIVDTQNIKPPRVLAYGPPGVGKTTFAASAPSPIFIQTEDGADVVGAARFPQPESYQAVEEQLGLLVNEKHDYQTLVIDSLDWLEPLVWAQLCEQHKFKSIEDPGYGKGYVMALDLWRRFISGINAVREKANMAVVVIAHSQIRRFEDPDADPFDRYEIKVHKRAADLIMEHCDLIGFCTYKTSTKQVDTGFGRKVSRAIGTGERVIKTSARPAFIAKSRYPIPDELPLVWGDVVAAIFNKE